MVKSGLGLGATENLQNYTLVRFPSDDTLKHIASVGYCEFTLRTIRNCERLITSIHSRVDRVVYFSILALFRRETFVFASFFIFSPVKNAYPHSFLKKALLVTALLGTVFMSGAGAADVRDIRVIGVQATPSAAQKAFVAETIRSLNMLTEDRIYIAETIPEAGLFNEETYANYHAVIVSPQVFALLERFNGYAAMASLGERTAGKWRSTVTVGLFVPELEGSATVKALSHGVIGTLEEDLPDTAFLVREEWRQRGLKPSSLTFARFQTTAEAENALILGKIDALAISSDMRERFVNKSALILSQTIPMTAAVQPVRLKLGTIELKMVEPRVDAFPEVISSTPAVPGWAFAASLGIKRDRVALLSATLKSLTFDADYQWMPAADYDPVLAALAEGQEPAYRGFQNRKWSEVVKDNIEWLGIFVLILFGILWHSVAAERLVRIRTRELMETMQQNRRAEKRFEDLERMTAVAQMSNIVAHELRQPLAAVSNFSMGLRQRMKNGNLNDDTLRFALGKILDENERASDIVEHVRNYAKRRERKTEKLDLRFLAAKVAASFLPNDGIPFVRVVTMDSVYVLADTLEMELILRNLVKNAVESVGEDPARFVTIAFDNVDKSLRVRVEDNGPVADPETFSGFASPLMSEKTAGLGLGLSIVRRLVESYDGHISLSVREPHGVLAEIVFPDEALGRTVLK